jgi:hypothetical protein
MPRGDKNFMTIHTKPTGFITNRASVNGLTARVGISHNDPLI